MIGFDIQINGQPLCLSAVGETGVMTALLTWAAHRQANEHPRENETLDLRVYGVSDTTRLKWTTDKPLGVGDVVVVRIVDVQSADEATRAVVEEVSHAEGQAGWFDEARAKHGKARKG